MHVSPKGRAFIEAQEGCRLRAYQDVKGVWTIGYGHTSMAGAPTVYRGLVVSKSEADEILARDLIKYEAEVLRDVHVPLTQCQFDALVSFTYNCGDGSLERVAVIAHLNAGDYAAVPRAMQEFDRSGGHVLTDLVHRRAAEARMFEGH